MKDTHQKKDCVIKNNKNKIQTIIGTCNVIKVTDLVMVFYIIRESYIRNFLTYLGGPHRNSNHNNHWCKMIISVTLIFPTFETGTTPSILHQFISA